MAPNWFHRWMDYRRHRSSIWPRTQPSRHAWVDGVIINNIQEQQSLKQQADFDDELITLEFPAGGVKNGAHY